mmetsp:Transcript_4028/g.11687  ORF Transcript_4028/g.11687 Transcript_4028/m.11687 type:complete len:239 (-) Transcript_4028:173-889(-)
MSSPDLDKSSDSRLRNRASAPSVRQSSDRQLRKARWARSGSALGRWALRTSGLMRSWAAATDRSSVRSPLKAHNWSTDTSSRGATAVVAAVTSRRYCWLMLLSPATVATSESCLSTSSRMMRSISSGSDRPRCGLPGGEARSRPRGTKGSGTGGGGRWRRGSSSSIAAGGSPCCTRSMTCCMTPWGRKLASSSSAAFSGSPSGSSPKTSMTNSVSRTPSAPHTTVCCTYVPGVSDCLR